MSMARRFETMRCQCEDARGRAVVHAHMLWMGARPGSFVISQTTYSRCANVLVAGPSSPHKVFLVRCPRWRHPLVVSRVYSAAR